MTIRARIARKLEGLAYRISAPPPPVMPPPTPPHADSCAMPGFPAGQPFLADPAFERAYALGKATGSWGPLDLKWRAAVVCWAGVHGKALAGDFVECGVNRGGYARMLVDYLDFASVPKRFVLIDTFAGLPEQFQVGSAASLKGIYLDTYAEVVATFARFANVDVVRGTIPEVLAQVLPDRVAFLSVDLNTAEPSVRAIEHFWPLMTPGAIVVLDDYNFEFFADQRAAFDDVAARMGVPILSLPTGQGLMVKT